MIKNYCYKCKHKLLSKESMQKKAIKAFKEGCDETDSISLDIKCPKCSYENNFICEIKLGHLIEAEHNETIIEWMTGK